MSIEAFFDENVSAINDDSIQGIAKKLALEAIKKKEVIENITDYSKGRFYILKTKVIDKFNKKKKRVLLQDHHCKECAFSPIDDYNDSLLSIVADSRPPALVYDNLPDDMKSKVQKLLQNHISERHSTRNKLIISEQAYFNMLSN